MKNVLNYPNISSHINCKSRLGISDMGYYECNLPENHMGNHQYETVTSRDVKYKIEWERDIYNDTNIDLKWLEDNTNIYDAIDYCMDKYKEQYISYRLDDKTFNSPIHGDSFTLSIHLELSEDYNHYLNNLYDNEDLNNYDEDLIEYEYEYYRDLINFLNIEYSKYKFDIRVNELLIVNDEKDLSY